MKIKKFLSGILASIITLTSGIIPENIISKDIFEAEITAEAYSKEKSYTNKSGTCGENVEWEISDDGVLTISGKGKINDYYTELDDYYTDESPFSYREDISSIVIKKGVTGIGNGTFRYCKSFESIIIPDSVTSIGNYAFYKCSSLESINIPDSITFIDCQAFRDCSALKNVYITDMTAWLNIEFYDQESNPLSNEADLYLNEKLVTDLIIPDSITDINDLAFYGCTSLKSVTIPESLKNIGSCAFLKCASLKRVYITDMTAWLNMDIDDFSTPLANGADLYLNGKLVTELTIPNSVAAIKEYKFYRCSSLKSVTIPDSVKYIGGHAFCSCSSLESVTIPDSVANIGRSAFFLCSSLKNVTIPQSVTSIGDWTFASCSSLKSVTIPDSVNS